MRGKGDKDIHTPPRLPTCQEIYVLIYKLINSIAKGSLCQSIKQFQNDLREKESDKDTVKAV